MGITQDTGRGGDTSGGYEATAKMLADGVRQPGCDGVRASHPGDDTVGFKPERLPGEFWESISNECAALDRRQIVDDDMRRCGQFERRYVRVGVDGVGQRVEYRCRILGAREGRETFCEVCGREVMVLVKGDIAEVLASSKRTEGKAQSGTVGGGAG